MKSPRVHRGFTLMEVMVALALITMLAGAISSFLWSLSARQISLSKASQEAQAADTLLDRLEGDLLGGVAGGERLGAGIEGTATRLRLLTRGVDLADGGVGDLQESVLAFSGSSLTMSRRPIGTSGGNAAPPPASVHALSSGLSRVRFRYFDGRSWKSSFNSQSLGRLPAAIEVEIWRAGRAPAMRAVSEESGTATGTEGGGAGGGTEWPEPDRSRVIVVPDGPDAAWGGSAVGGGP